ncbi:TPA: phage holin, lambda family [Enterobacter roggenkampii]|nr:phage holin, lambda family [Enterobacter roggenkampii]HDT2114846.1 phage holin, lambda family [Enterobacter roggenkampii]
MKMHNDPHSWTEFIELLHSWWRGETPMGAVLLSVAMAALRIAYGGGGWKKILLEGAICGALTLTAVSALDYFNLPQSLSIAIGGALGFVGVEQVKVMASRVFNSRFGGGDANQ